MSHFILSGLVHLQDAAVYDFQDFKARACHDPLNCFLCDKQQSKFYPAAETDKNDSKSEIRKSKNTLK